MVKSHLDRLAHIYEVANRTNVWRQREIVHALISCLTPYQASEALAKLAPGDEIVRRYLLRRIGRDVENQGFLPCHEHLVTGLMAAFSTLDYSGKQSCGYCLSSIHDYMPEYLQEQVVLFFLRSEYIGMRRRGYKVLRTNWHPKYEPEVSSVWAGHHDTECALLIVDRFPNPFLTEHSDELEHALSHMAAAARLFIRLGAIDLNKVTSLEQRDPITFAYVMTKLGTVLTEEKALELFERSKWDDRVGLLIWCFGQMGLRSTLIDILNRSAELQEEQVALMRHRHGL